MILGVMCRSEKFKMTLYVVLWSLNSEFFCIIYLFPCLSLVNPLLNDKIITALLAILIVLGGWTLSRTFSLSQVMVLVKEKISNIEDKVSKFKPNKRNKKNKKRKQN